MKCPRCQAENKADARFCEDCGARVEVTCPSCGTPVTPGKKYCRFCGAALIAGPAGRFASPESYTPKHLAEKIITSKSALEGERKLVTVLFADVKGSMELLADRDPEEARNLLDPALQYMMEAVHRYEGTVNQVMGDGIMALFGAPLAHEDHAVRACYAALRMHEAVKRYAEEVRRAAGFPLQIRIGLNSGEVVVRSISSDLHMDYTAVGQTTHLAARMEQMALPGSTLLSPETLRLAEGYVEVRSLGPLPVKGLAAPLEVYELSRAAALRSRFQAAAARGLTRFVGRDREMDHLHQALERAQAGHGQIVAVVGEPGVGKSRLTWEFAHSHRTQGWLLLESASVSYGRVTNYLPLLDLVRAYFAIESADNHRKIREKVTGKLLSLDRHLEACIEPMLWLLDVPAEEESWARLEPSQRRQRVIDAVKHLLLRESQAQPLIVVFEDLHWIDVETQAVLDRLVENLPGARILLLVNYRPEYQHGWGGKTYYRQFQVDPLPPESAAALLDAMLGTEAALAPLKRLVIERTEGNPFFIEETVRSLVETGILAGQRGAYGVTRLVQDLQVPATAHAMLAARIDRLDLEDKRLLQAAAVVGTEVPFALLEAVADEPEARLRQGLAHLQATEFLYEKRLFPEIEYAFRHALTHEVAYGSLLGERRRVLHARIVGAIEELYRDRLAEHIEQLAHHALRGDAREKAIHYLRQAGNKAAARSALPDARAWFEQTLDLLAALPASPSTVEQAFEIRLELRAVLTQLGEPRLALGRLREAEVLAERLHDEQRRARVCSVLMTLHTLLGELDEAVATGSRALAMAGRLGDLRLRILTASYLEQAQYYRGEYQRVVDLATEALAILPAEWAHEHFGMVAPASVYARAWLVMSLAELGRFGEGAEQAAEAIRLAQRTHHPYTIGLAHRAAGTFHLLVGDWARARSLLDHGLAALRGGNVMLSLPPTAAGSAWALAQLGEASEALDRLREAEEAVAGHATAGMRRAWDYHILGRTSLLLGRLDEARRLGERAVDFLSSQPGGAAHALHLLGDIETHPERFDANGGEDHYRRALALAESYGMRPLLAHCHLGLGKLYRRAGESEAAQDHLSTATTMYRHLGMTYWLQQAEAELRGMG